MAHLIQRMETGTHSTPCTPALLTDSFSAIDSDDEKYSPSNQGRLPKIHTPPPELQLSPCDDIGCPLPSLSLARSQSTWTPSASPPPLDIMHNPEMMEGSPTPPILTAMSHQCPANMLYLEYNLDSTEMSPDFIDISDCEDSDDGEYSECGSQMSSTGSESGSESSSEYVSMLDMIMLLDETEDQIQMADAGYTEIKELRDTLQGKLLRAETKSGDFVAIKKIDTAFHSKNEATDEYGMTYIVDQDVSREAEILKKLNEDPHASKGIVRFKDFFQNKSFLYLVTEYIDGLFLDKFIITAHQYIEEGRLKRDLWASTVQQIMGQITSTINYLHSVRHCCHLDLCTENVMVSGVSFEELDDGSITLKGTVNITIVDFGVAQIFTEPTSTDAIQMPRTKTRLSLFNEIYQSPESQTGDVYDASAADMWSIGMMFYEAMVGQPLFEHTDDESYDAVQTGDLQEFMAKENLQRFFGPHSFSLLQGLLDVDPSTRLRALEAEKHQWFSEQGQMDVE